MKLVEPSRERASTLFNEATRMKAGGIASVCKKRKEFSDFFLGEIDNNLHAESLSSSLSLLQKHMGLCYKFILSIFLLIITITTVIIVALLSIICIFLGGLLHTHKDDSIMLLIFFPPPHYYF